MPDRDLPAEPGWWRLTRRREWVLVAGPDVPPDELADPFDLVLVPIPPDDLEEPLW